MPATGRSNSPGGGTAGIGVGGGGIVGGFGVGASAGAALRTNDAGRASPLTVSFLERHGHSPLNLGVHVATAQTNTSRQRTDRSPGPGCTTAAAATPNVPTHSAGGTKHSIRIVPAMDSFTRLPLRFDPIDRKVEEGEVLVVGRHTDRLVSEHPSAIVFRSKVVSRNHAKMWLSSGQWYLQDVGSSSGTFLNHIRLSSPNVESTPFPIKDGDIIQLGIDFRGGAEEVFRCVKMRIETEDVGARISDYNVAAHIQLRKNLAMRKPSEHSPNSLSECSICLYPIGPGQALFVASCSHTWHFKCIRPIITEHFPLFMCPNCRQDADLEAPVDVETETWEAILRTTGPCVPMADADTAQNPQIKTLSFKPFPDLSSPSASQRDTNFLNDLQSLNIDDQNEASLTAPTSPVRELSPPRTLSPGLEPINENDERSPPPRDTPELAIPIPGTVRALSSARDGFEDIAGLSTTPTIDRGPFVYGDMTVNADAGAEATTSDRNVQLPPRSMSNDATPEETKSSS